MFKNMCGIVVLLVLCVVCLGTAKAGLVYNGGFETNPVLNVIPDGWTEDPNTDYSYGSYNGWNGGMTPHSGDWVYHVGWNWYQGGAYQDIATEVGKIYEASLWATGWETVAGQQGTVRAGTTLDPVAWLNETFTVPDFAVGGWEEYLYTFTAQDTTTRLTLWNPAGSAISVDDVDVVAIPNLVWDNSGNGNWGDIDGGSGLSRWLDSGVPTTDIPDSGSIVTLDGFNVDTVTVQAPRTARELDIQGGSLAIAADQSLAVTYNANFAAGTSLTLGNNASLSVGGELNVGAGNPVTVGSGVSLGIGGGGAIDAIEVGAGVAIDTGARLEVNTMTAAAGILTKRGPGTMNVQSLSADPATAIRVEGGMLRANGSDPLSGVTDVQLAGGTLSLNAGGKKVAYWSFNDPTNLGTDNSGNGHDALEFGTPLSLDPGVSGAALDLYGTEYLYVDDHEDFRTFPNGMTISLWVEGFSGNTNTPFARWGPNAEASGYGVGWQEWGADWYYGDRTTWGTIPDGFETDTGWHLYTLTWDPGDNNRVVSYFDGVKLAESNFPMAFSPTNYLTIGADNRSLDVSPFFDGSIDEVFIYNAALSSTEVAALHATPGSLPAETSLDPVKMAALHVTVSADSRLDVNDAGGTIAALGSLTIQQGLLTTSGNTSIAFQSTAVSAAAVEAGFDTQVNTSPGTLSAPGAMIVKRGLADLIVDSEASDLTGATFDIQEGRLVGYHGSNPIAGATLDINGGEVLLSAKPGAASPVIYDNKVVLTSNGTLAAGPGDAGETGTMTVQLDHLTDDIQISAGRTLTLGSSGAYSLHLADALDGPAGNVEVDSGNVTAGAGGQLDTLTARGGQFTAAATLDVQTLNLRGGTVDSGPGPISVNQKMEIGGTTFSTNAENPFSVAGPDLGNPGVPHEIRLTGGTFNILGPASSMPEDPVIYYPFDEVNAGMTPNQGAGGSQYDGVVHNNPGLTVTPDTGQLNNALNFAGGRVVSANPMQIQANQPFTFSAWVNTPLVDIQTWRRIVMMHSYQWGAYLGTGVTGTEFQSIISGDDSQSGGQSNLPNVWQHLALSYDGTTARMYINNVEILPIQPVYGPYANDAYVSVGNNIDAYNEGWYGLIDEVFVYDRGLDAASVGVLYDAGQGLTSRTVNRPNSNITVEATTTLIGNTPFEAVVGDLTVAGDVTLTVEQAPALSVGNASLGNNSQINVAKLVVRDTLDVGASPGTATVYGTLELAPTATFNVEISENLHDKIIIDGDPGPPAVIDSGNMHGSLAVKGLKPMRDAGGLVVYGDKVLTIGETANPGTEYGFDPAFQFTAGVPRSYGAEALSQGLTGNDIVPNLGDPLGREVIVPALASPVYDNAGLWFGGASDEATGEDGVYWASDTIEIGVFQAAPGDTDGNRKFEGPDILRILTASQFGDGELLDGNGDSIVVWGTGDFDGNHKVEGADILLFLTESLFGDGTYGDKGQVVFPAVGAGGDVKLVVTEEGLVIDAGDAKINGYMLESEAGILTGDDANNIGLFQEDTDDRISGAFAITLKGEHALGDVIGQTDVDLTGDLSLTYTLVGQPGLFTANVVVPEPGTVLLLLSGLAALLLWRRRM